MPGSGKSTTAQFVGQWLAQKGKQSAVHLEGDWDHPADYESVACLDVEEYAQLSAQFPTWTDLLEREARLLGSERLFSYQKLRQQMGNDAPDALFAALARYEVYELPVAKYQRLVLQRWRDFAAAALGQDVVYVFECCFLQSPLTMLLGRNDTPVDMATSFIREIAAIIHPLQPLLVYLDPSDIESNLRRVAQSRPQAWLDFVIDYHTRQGHGKAQDWQGFEGLILFYAYRQAVEFDLLSRLPFAKLIVNHSTWESDQARIADFLSLTF